MVSLRKVRWVGVPAFLLLTLALYIPAIHFGFWWDDPTWFSHVIGRSWFELILPSSQFQFYRPGTFLYNRLFLQADGTFFPPFLHLAQIGWHLLNISLLYAIARGLGTKPVVATVAAGLLALYPFAHQAVAWAAPQQPIVATFQYGAFWLYLLGRKRQRLILYLFSLLLYVAALTIQESAVMLAWLPLGYEIIQNKPVSKWSLFYLPLAGLFAMVWWLAPRQLGVTRWALDPQVGLYLGQGLAYPVVGRVNGYVEGYEMPAFLLFWLIFLPMLWLLWLAKRNGQGKLALFLLGWVGLAIVPAFIGLPYSYVSLGARLLYHAGTPIALFWAIGLVQPHKWHTLGHLILLFVLGQSWLLLQQFNQMYQLGTEHLGELIASSQNSEEMLVINFPDRYQPHRSPYPLGYWGMTLAPVSVSLGAFAGITTPYQPHSREQALPWLNKTERDNAPWQFDLRGEIISPDQLPAIAQNGADIYLSRYTNAGTFDLDYVGYLLPSTPTTSPTCLVQFGDSICLPAAQAQIKNGQLLVTLTWLIYGQPSPQQTVFLHLSQPNQPPIAQADGDLWGGMLPFANLPPAQLLVERRVLPLPDPYWANSDSFRLGVGVYDWVTGARVPAHPPLINNTYSIPISP